MKNQALEDLLSEHLIINGSKSFATLVSRAMDKARVNNGISIHDTREKVVNELLRLNELILTERP